MVPFEVAEEDVAVTIDHNYIIAGVSGQAPIIKVRTQLIFPSPCSSLHTSRVGYMGK